MIIDSHFHLGCLSGYYNYDLKLGSVLQLMDKLNISLAISSHAMGLTYGDLEGSMEDSIHTYEESGGRIISYYIFDPLNAQRCLEIMEKYPNRKIFKGIKIHPSFHGVSADDERYEAVWIYAMDNKLPILAHTWDISLTNPVQALSFPARFEAYIKKYHQVILIMGHSGGRHDGIKEAARLGRRYSNVYFDTAGDIYSNCYLEFLVGQVGSDRILFGTDYSMMDQRNMLGVVLGADISLEDKENILYGNSLTVFNLETAVGGGKLE
ncbi:MAG: amidohydrolase family protein [Clostridiales bacterium]|nr:amidohydrolase family protein [Clostridiales bacterium]